MIDQMMIECREIAERDYVRCWGWSPSRGPFLAGSERCSGALRKFISCQVGSITASRMASDFRFSSVRPAASETSGWYDAGM